MANKTNLKLAIQDIKELKDFCNRWGFTISGFTNQAIRKHLANMKRRLEDNEE